MFFYSVTNGVYTYNGQLWEVKSHLVLNFISEEHVYVFKNSEQH